MKLLVTTQVVDKNDPILGFFIDWLTEFAKYFERIDVICLKKGEYELPPHVHVHSLGKEEGVSRVTYVYRFYKYFIHVFFKVRVDYVFYHMGAIYNIMGAPFYFMRKLLSTKFYWWKAHGHINLVGRTALRFVDTVYTASEKSFPINTPKRKVVGHAICVDDREIKENSNKWSLPRINMVTVGRVTRIKKLEIAIDTCFTLWESGFDPYLEIIGPIQDREYENELKNRIGTLKIDERVIFTGEITNELLRKKIEKFNVLIHPSQTGSVDKVVLEAMAVGVIPISQCAAYGSLFGDGIPQICVDENTSKEYTRIIKNLCDNYQTTELNQISISLSKIIKSKHALGTLVKRIFVS